jgi:hypothetical protein
VVSSPSSIYFLIPPLTPTTSAIHTQFGKPPDGISLVGYDNVIWDDILASVAIDGAGATTLACGYKSVAVGFASGEVALYNHQSF